MHLSLLCFAEIRWKLNTLKKNKHENLLNNNLVADSCLQNAQLEVDGILESA